MSTLYVTHHDCIEHDTGHFHPENADRLRGINRALEGEDFMFLQRDYAPHADMEQILRVHPMSHVDHVMHCVPVDGHNELEDDTILSPKSGEAALRSVGGVISAVDAVMRGEVKNAFCGVRPPGHHAELQKMMGFCLFNNVAIGAFHARDVHGAKRVAVIDWDVHHGNGTQHIFWDEPDMFYGSTHQYPIFPGTGAKEETGAHGNIVNVPLAANSQPKEFRDGLAEHIMPAVRAFKPDLLLISAGFDAHANDPMANLRFTVDDYVWATRELMDLADEICEGRIVSVLEGGYDVPTLAACVAAHIRTLMGG